MFFKLKMYKRYLILWRPEPDPGVSHGGVWLRGKARGDLRGRGKQFTF